MPVTHMNAQRVDRALRLLRVHDAHFEIVDFVHKSKLRIAVSDNNIA